MLCSLVLATAARPLDESSDPLPPLSTRLSRDAARLEGEAEATAAHALQQDDLFAARHLLAVGVPLPAPRAVRVARFDEAEDLLLHVPPVALLGHAVASELDSPPSPDVVGEPM